MSESERPSARSRRRRLCLLAIGGLFVVSVPWYREPGATPEIWGGVPDWVAVSVLCYAAVAVLNAVAWQATDVPDDPGPEADATGPEGRS